jgi:hypothetical protein
LNAALLCSLWISDCVSCEEETKKERERMRTSTKQWGESNAPKNNFDFFSAKTQLATSLVLFHSLPRQESPQSCEPEREERSATQHSNKKEEKKKKDGEENNTTQPGAQVWG